MDYELTALLLAAVLPIYPALWGIYQKIGRFDRFCEEFTKHCEDHQIIAVGITYGPGDTPDT
jgi:hypothetical protein